MKNYNNLILDIENDFYLIKINKNWLESAYSDALKSRKISQTVKSVLGHEEKTKEKEKKSKRLIEKMYFS